MSAKEISTLLVIVLILIWTGIHTYGITNEESSRRVLEDAGMTEITFHRERGWACGKGGFWVTGYRAINPQGREVQGVVCEGLLSHPYIRN